MSIAGIPYQEIPFVEVKLWNEQTLQMPTIMPVLALKDVVVFPSFLVPLSVGRKRSVEAVNQALAGNRLIFMLTQKDPEIEVPKEEDLYEVGCVALITRMLKLPDGNMRIIVQGQTRARVEKFLQMDPFIAAKLDPLPEPEVPKDDVKIEALVRNVKKQIKELVELGKEIAPEVVMLLEGTDSPSRLADMVGAHIGFKTPDLQRILETTDIQKRLELVHELLAHEIAIAQVQKELSSMVKGEMDRSQREYYLRQQLKAIKRELGEEGGTEEEIEEYRKKAEEIGLSEEARKEVEKQLKRLSTMSQDSAEASVIRTWLDWILGLPWDKVTKDNLDLDRAKKILDEDHYDLDKIKERIIEFLAVRRLKPDSKGPILCFVGPPGVGKTSLGRSIARALGRKFVRISLGGVRDEAEIRGHRRTYVGALPGRIIQGIHQAGTSNPVFVLDEVDKIGADFRGDPSSALLEVLDPEQNHSFRDHYLGVAYDLSKVLFIATANITDTIHPAFLDRMEVIHLSGYTEEEKVEIAKRHLIPKQMEENGLPSGAVVFPTSTLKLVIQGYTREAGLRNLEREIGALCRKVAVRIASGKRAPKRITPSMVERWLGPRKYLPETQLKESRVGIVTGLAYTPYGGDVLFVEALAFPGKGELKLTGSLGDVMKESAQAALSFARSHASEYGIPEGWFDDHSLHVHVPAGAIPKDGPSAGITILTAMISVASGRKVRHDLAMTGEITLRGDLLPVGGIKEKVMAALRVGITDIVLPEENRRDLADLPPKARRQAKFVFARNAHQVLEMALLKPEASGDDS